MNENADGFAWVLNYAILHDDPGAYQRYKRTLEWLSFWERRPDSGYYRLWYDICHGKESDE